MDSHGEETVSSEFLGRPEKIFLFRDGRLNGIKSGRRAPLSRARVDSAPPNTHRPPLFFPFLSLSFFRMAKRPQEISDDDEEDVKPQPSSVRTLQASFIEDARAHLLPFPCSLSLFQSKKPKTSTSSNGKGKKVVRDDSDEEEEAEDVEMKEEEEERDEEEEDAAYEKREEANVMAEIDARGSAKEIGVSTGNSRGTLYVGADIASSISKSLKWESSLESFSTTSCATPSSSTCSLSSPLLSS